jgi:magnesium transporter
MFRKRHPHAGARPGTLLIAPDAPQPRIRVVQYSTNAVTDEVVDDPSTLRDRLRPGSVTWIDVQGFGNEATLQSIAEQFQIHPLAMEDVVNVPQRPKAEAYAQQLLFIARTMTMPNPASLDAGQLSMIVGPDYVITFQNRQNNRLDPVRQRIANPTARLRRNGVDYLAYAILDTVVDSLYPVLAAFGERLESIESQILSDPRPTVLGKINTLRNQLMLLRRAIWPQRDAVRTLLAGDNELLGETVRMFLRDTLDHCEQIADVVEMYRDTATGLLNTYMSAVAHRSNEIMKVLTIISSIFVPMTFVAGVYGMNFESMPELGFTWSYPLVWGVMLSLAIGMLWYFRRNGWLSISSLSGTREDDSPAAAVGPHAEEVPVTRAHILEHDRPTPVGGRQETALLDGDFDDLVRGAA